MILNDEKLSTAAQTALRSCRNVLAQAFPMMIPALYIHELKETNKVETLTSDYSCIYYSAEFVVELYKENKYKLCALVLHTILHCMFMHQTQAYGNEELGRYADASVQLIMERLAPSLLKKAKTPPVFVRRASIAEQISFKKLLAQAGSGSQLGKTVLELCEEIQILDDHTAWKTNLSPKDAQSDSEKTQEMIEQWQRAVLKIAEDSDQTALGLLPGSGDGSVDEIIRPAKDSGISYSALIERYLKKTEASCLNPEELDMPSYALGMELYGNVPLIEESEVKDDLLSGNIIIALDTSGSCSGKVLENFVSETMSILDQIPSEDRTVRIIKCDDSIQSEVVIRPGDSLDVKGLCRCSGFGGTDFRPVFRRAEELNKSESIDLLIYFTDACGAFPHKQPSFNSLILVNDGDFSCYMGFLPKWANAWLRKDKRYVEIRKRG